MTIVGLGMDATEIERIAATVERYGERFLHRVFTPRELEYCMRRKNPAPHLAGRFAAKEAGMKAIGTGHAFGVLWKDLEVIRHGGPPQLQFHNAAAGHFAYTVNALPDSFLQSAQWQRRTCTGSPRTR